MKVVVTGANSAVGQAVLRCGSPQAAAPVTFVAAVRSQRAADQIRSQLTSPNEVIRISYEDPGILDSAFEGAFAVIHLPGILFERPDSTYEQANVASTRSVVESAKRSALRKIVLVSATGADEASRNRYYRTKGEAEALVRASGLPYTVLRAPLLLGPSTAGAAALQRNISGGRAKLIGGGRHLQQPLYVDDLARAVLACCHAGAGRQESHFGPRWSGLFAGARTRGESRSPARPERPHRLDSEEFALLGAGHSPTHRQAGIFPRRTRGDHCRYALGPPARCV